MDPDTINQLIAAGAGLGGAIIGAFSASLQHRRTLRAERRKEAQTRERAAAEKCSSLVTRLGKLKEQGRSRVADDAWEEQQNEMQRLDEQLRAEALYLPADVRRRVDLAREVLSSADDIVSYGFFYCSSGTIASHIATHTNEILTTFIREEAIPDSEMTRRLSVALQELDDQRHYEYAEEVHEREEAERRWLAEHPEAPPVTRSKGGLLSRLRRRLPHSRGGRTSEPT